MWLQVNFEDAIFAGTMRSAKTSKFKRLENKALYGRYVVALTVNTVRGHAIKGVLIREGMLECPGTVLNWLYTSAIIRNSLDSSLETYFISYVLTWCSGLPQGDTKLNNDTW